MEQMSMSEEDVGGGGLALDMIDDGDRGLYQFHVKGKGAQCRACWHLNCNWGESGVQGTAGACWHCFRCRGGSCGDPCARNAACYCCWCYLCCNPCMRAKLLAYSSGQECHVVNHCGPYVLACVWALFWASVSLVVGRLLFYVPGIHCIGCSLCMALASITRRNLRKANDVGYDGSWVGDCFMATCPCTSLCSDCQQFRAVPVESWDWFGDCKRRGCHCMDQETLGDLLKAV